MALNAVQLRERSAELAAETEAQYRAKYGRHYDDAMFLRRKGFTVIKGGGPGFVVDGRNVDVATFAALVDRERSREQPQPEAPAPVQRKIGDVVPLDRSNRKQPMTETAETGEACKCGKPIRHRGTCWHRRGLSGPPEKKPRVAAEKPAPKAAPQAARRTPKPAPQQQSPLDAALDHLRGQLARIQGAIVALEMAKEIVEPVAGRE